MKSFTGALLLILLGLRLMAGCVSHPVSSTGHEAHAAQLRGDWVDAVQLWRQAIQEQKEQKGIWNEQFAGPSARSAVLYYELGRSEGVICQWDEAARDLNQALQLDEIFHGPVWMDLVELGRACHAHGNNSQAEVYFDRLFARMPVDEVARRDADGLIAVCEEAGDVAAALGKFEKSGQFHDKAASLRNTYPQATTPKDWTPYGLACATTSSTH